MKRDRLTPLRRLQNCAMRVGLTAALVLVCGCRSLSFYGQAIKGQYQMWARQESIERLLADPATPEHLKAKLKLVGDLRAFAREQLKLPVNGHYERYADLGRDVAVWNVEATPEFSMEPKTWWYPIVGRLEYRGYFSREGAVAYARSLQKKGYETYLAPATAYSTLGWFKDPVLNTFLFDEDTVVAETLFHELAHQRLFAAGDTDFDEAFATTVGQEGVRRWLRAAGDTAGLARYQSSLERTGRFVQIVAETRARLQTLYGDHYDGEGRLKAARSRTAVLTGELRREKERILANLRERYLQLKRDGGDYADYDGWFSGEINNPKLNSVAAYYDFVPGFERLLKSNGGDLEAFFTAAERLAKLPKNVRHRRLGTASP